MVCPVFKLLLRPLCFNRMLSVTASVVKLNAVQLKPELSLGGRRAKP